MKKLLFILTVIAFYSGPTMAATDLNAATNDACKCLEKPYKAADNSKNKTQAELMNMVNSLTKCFEGLQKKYPEIDKSTELQKKLMTMVEKECPNPATAMKNTR